MFGSASESQAKPAAAKAIAGEEVDAAEVPPNAKCGVCGEQFEKYYNDERDCWLLKGGVRHPVNAAMLVHTDCLGEAEAELLAKHRLTNPTDGSAAKRMRGDTK